MTLRQFLRYASSSGPQSRLHCGLQFEYKGMQHSKLLRHEKI